jgi:hypothetical protein
MSAPQFNPDLTTRDNLAAFGMTLVPSGKAWPDSGDMGRRSIVDASGTERLFGSVFDANAWMRAGCPERFELRTSIDGDVTCEVAP